MRRPHAVLASHLVLVLLASVAAPAGAAPLGKSTEARLEAALGKAFAKTKAPGVSWWRPTPTSKPAATSPTPVLTSALAEVISPGNVPAGTH